MAEALLLDEAGTAQRLTRLPFGESRDERWLQGVVFEHPELLPIEEIDPGAGQVVPLCRELALPKETELVFLDMLGVTPAGRLVLVECKLWRNPQAQRYVVGQVLEYAALLRRWRFADLTAKLKPPMRSQAENPIFEAVRARVPGVEEARLVDAVSRSLAQGAFDLLVVGDGIRTDLLAIERQLNEASGLTSRLALVEMQLWRGVGGGLVVLPQIPFRTEVMQQRVVVDQSGAPLPMAPPPDADEQGEEAEPGRVRSPRDPALAAASRAFWQHFIDTARFDHPDQPPPRHATHNTVRMELPAPGKWLTGYRAGQTECGLFARFRDTGGKAAFEALSEQLPAMRQETGLDLRAHVWREEPFKADLTVTRSQNDAAGQEGLLAWLRDAANRMVSALRPRLTLLAERR